jgi:hypothetical protein
MYGTINMSQASVLWRKALHARIGELDASLKYCMDVDLWHRFANIEPRFGYLPITLSNFRIHADSKTVRDSDGMHLERRMLRLRNFGVDEAKSSYRVWRALYGLRRMMLYVLQGDGLYLAGKLVRRLTP